MCSASDLYSNPPRAACHADGRRTASRLSVVNSTGNHEAAMTMAVKKGTTRKGTSTPAPPPYTSRIIKASALLDDTKTLLSHWDVDLPVSQNLDRIRRENIFAK